MRVVLEHSDLVRILSEYFDAQLREEDIIVTQTEPLEIGVRNVNGLPSARPDVRTVVAEELKKILLEATKPSDEPLSADPVPEVSPMSENRTMSVAELLDPFSRHNPSGSARNKEPLEPLPPLPQVGDFVDDPTAEYDPSVSFDDPGPTTAAEVAAARRTKGGA